MAGSGWDDSVVGPGVQVNADGTAERPAAGGGGNYAGIRGLAGRAKGKRFFEVRGLNSTCSVGLVDENADVGSILGGGNDPSQWGIWLSYGYIYYRDTSSNGNQLVDDSSTSTTVIGVLMDFDNHKVNFFEDGVEVYEFPMSFADDMVLYPGASMGTSTYGIELQTVEPFEYPPEESFLPWDKPDSLLITSVSGNIQIDSAATSRTVKAFSFEKLAFELDGGIVQESKPLGQDVSDGSGDYKILLRDGFNRDVFLVAFDDYGKKFTADENVTVGQRIRPAIPNGFVYECTGSGTMPSSEPAWSNDTENDQSIGTASFRAHYFYRPLAHGPVTPVATEAGDDYWENTKSLIWFSGVDGSTDFPDQAGLTWTVHGSPEITDERPRFDGVSGAFDGATDYLEIASLGFTPEESDFTFEFEVYIPSMGSYNLLSNRDNTVGGGAGIQIRTESDGRVRCMFIESGGTSNIDAPAGSLVENEWIYVKFVREGSNGWVQINDTIVATKASLDPPPVSGLTWCMGAIVRSSVTYTPRYFPGYMKNFRATNVARPYEPRPVWIFPDE